MENATKGLMIAGAILIAIVLIGIGVFLVSQAQGFTKQGGQQFTEMEKQTFNSPIEQYEGKRNGSEVKNLLTKLNTVNMQLTTDETYEQKGIGITLEDGTNKLDIAAKAEYTNDVSKTVTTARAKINTGKTYTVVLDYDNSTGLISNVTITVVSTQKPL